MYNREKHLNVRKRTKSFSKKMFTTKKTSCTM
ncbi:hypothetical protein VPHK567_0383 [Vibrio phage K567]